jgi:hypothetical protein
VRAQFGDVVASSSRYVYVAAVFTLPMLAEALRTVSWRPHWQAAVAAVTGLVCFHGTSVLNEAIDLRDHQFARQKAMLQTVWYLRGDPRLDPAAFIDPVNAPTLTVRLYLQTRAELGSPLPNLDAKGLGGLDPQAVVDARNNVLSKAP